MAMNRPPSLGHETTDPILQWWWFIIYLFLFDERRHASRLKLNKQTNKQVFFFFEIIHGNGYTASENLNKNLRKIHVINEYDGRWRARARGTGDAGSKK